MQIKRWKQRNGISNTVFVNDFFVKNSFDENNFEAKKFWQEQFLTKKSMFLFEPWTWYILRTTRRNCLTCSEWFGLHCLYSSIKILSAIWTFSSLSDSISVKQSDEISRSCLLMAGSVAGSRKMVSRMSFRSRWCGISAMKRGFEEKHIRQYWGTTMSTISPKSGWPWRFSTTSRISCAEHNAFSPTFPKIHVKVFEKHRPFTVDLWDSLTYLKNLDWKNEYMKSYCTFCQKNFSENFFDSRF